MKTSSPGSRATWLPTLLLVTSAACVGSVGRDERSGGTGGPMGAAGPGGAPAAGEKSGAGGGTGPGETSPPMTPAPGPIAGLPFPLLGEGEPSALRRLSRDELLATLVTLTGKAPDRDDLPEEQRPDHGALLTGGSAFIASEIGELKQVMSTFAAQVASSMLTRSGCLQSQQAQRDCLFTWASGLGDQALRRPLRPVEKDRLRAMVAVAGETKEDDVAAVEGVLTALFFSPSFLYRTEVGTPAAGRKGVRALADLELASRLSYLATLAPPDAELTAAARVGRLQDGAERARQFARLAKTPLGQRALTIFVLEWLGANEPKIGLKSERYTKSLGSSYEAAARASVESTIRKVMVDGADPTVAALMTTDVYLADAPVQKIRSAAGTGATATEDTPLTGRLGILMHPYVLAAHTKEDGISPFQLGLFMKEAFLCETVPAPPADAMASARNDVPAGLSLRESLDYRVSAGPACVGCHSSFAPLGYALLPFDPVGRWMKTDPSGKPWDLTGKVSTAVGTAVEFSSPADLVRALAQHPQLPACFAKTAVEWAWGRKVVAEDEPLLRQLNDVAQKSQGNVSALFSALVKSPAFAETVAPR